MVSRKRLREKAERMARMYGYKRPKKRPVPPPDYGAVIHEHELSTGKMLYVREVRSPSGFRYCVHDQREVTPLDDGMVYGTYEEAAAVYTRTILDDGDAEEDDFVRGFDDVTR